MRDALARHVLALLCLLAAGCTESALIVSAVDMAPVYSRSAEAPLPAGLYCPLTVSWRADGEIVGVAPGDRRSCMTNSWDGTRRLIVGQQLVASGDERPQRAEIAMAPLGDGLFVAQTANVDGEGAIRPAAPYVITSVLSAGGVYSLTPGLESGAVDQIFSRFPQIEFVPFDADEGRRYIKSGAHEDIAAALREVATLSLSLPDQNGNLTLALLVRVNTPAAESVSSLVQRLDLAAIRTVATRLAKQAPTGIVLEER